MSVCGYGPLGGRIQPLCAEEWRLELAQWRKIHFITEMSCAKLLTSVCFGFKIKLKFPGPSGRASWQAEARESKVQGPLGQICLKIKSWKRAGQATIVLRLESRAFHM